jgi:hypothetical protein
MRCQWRGASRTQLGACRIARPRSPRRRGGGRERILGVALVGVREQGGRPQHVIATGRPRARAAFGGAEARGFAGGNAVRAVRNRVPIKRLRAGDGQRAQKYQGPERHRKNPELASDSEPVGTWPACRSGQVDAVREWRKWSALLVESHRRCRLQSNLNLSQSRVNFRIFGFPRGRLRTSSSAHSTTKNPGRAVICA